MRLLHVQKVKGIGGSERHLLALLPGLAAAGDEVRMMVLAPGEDEGRFLEAARDAGIDVVATPIGGDADPRPYRAIAHQVRAFRPDLVHTHLVHADLWGQIAVRRAGVPSVRSVHNVSARYRREPGRTAGRLAGRLATHTVAISEHVAGFVRNLGLAPPARIRVVPYGIDVAAWDADPATRASARLRFQMTDRDIVVGMAARLIPGKGHAMTIEALRSTQQDLPTMRLLVAGDGPLRAALEERARSLAAGAVCFTGHLDDVRPFFAACDLVAFPTLPSLGEGFGLTALEAMASGHPVIATDVGALPEVVGDGVTGMVVRPRSEAIADALKALGKDPARRAEMGQAGRDRAAHEFSLDAMITRTRAVYREALTR